MCLLAFFKDRKELVTQWAKEAEGRRVVSGVGQELLSSEIWTRKGWSIHEGCRNLANRKESCCLWVTDFQANFGVMSSGRRWRNKKFKKHREGKSWRHRECLCGGQLIMGNTRGWADPETECARFSLPFFRPFMWHLGLRWHGQDINCHCSLSYFQKC